MDDSIYSEAVINRFMLKNLFFNDATLKKYYDNDDLTNFRKRLYRLHKKDSMEKIVYAYVTDSIRDIVYRMVGELSDFLKTSGDLVISGGEAFNYYIERKDRIITSDIDTKFVPRFKYDSKYFGKLQAIKVLLWNKLGEIASKYDREIRSRFSKKTKLEKFLGFGFAEKGPFVTRRYILIKKKKSGDGPEPSKMNVFIDVELFALDLKTRYFSPAKGQIVEKTIGGILDIPFMRPGEFGFEVVETKKKGVTYRNRLTGTIVRDDRIYVAGRRFLLDDVYLMQKLGLRPEKREKDRQRMVKLSKIISSNVSINSSDTIESIYQKIHKLPMTIPRRRKTDGRVNMKAATAVNPRKYLTYTTPPDEERLSRQFVIGLKASTKGVSVPGFQKTKGNQRFNINDRIWRTSKNKNYVKNEYNFRPSTGGKIPEKFNILKTLYGYRPTRDDWVPKQVLLKAAQIPFVGLKK